MSNVFVKGIITLWKKYHGTIAKISSEWCEDGYKTRQDDEVSARGVRGGNYLANKEYCRITSRYAITPNYRDHGIGFRLALTL